MNKTLHPSIVEFKAFVKKYPKMTQEVRAGKKTWQEFYEEWAIIGEKDDYWKTYEDSSGGEAEEVIEGEVIEDTQSGKRRKKGNPLSSGDVKAPMEWIGTAFHYLKDVDMNQLQSQITHVGATIASIQSVINQFRNPAGETRQTPATPKKQSPPTFRQED